MFILSDILKIKLGIIFDEKRIYEVRITSSWYCQVGRSIKFCMTENTKDKFGMISIIVRNNISQA